MLGNDSIFGNCGVSLFACFLVLFWFCLRSSIQISLLHYMLISPIIKDALKTCVGIYNLKCLGKGLFKILMQVFAFSVLRGLFVFSKQYV